MPACSNGIYYHTEPLSRFSCMISPWSRGVHDTSLATDHKWSVMVRLWLPMRLATAGAVPWSPNGPVLSDNPPYPWRGVALGRNDHPAKKLLSLDQLGRHKYWSRCSHFFLVHGVFRTDYVLASERISVSLSLFSCTRHTADCLIDILSFQGLDLIRTE